MALESIHICMLNHICVSRSSLLEVHVLELTENRYCSYRKLSHLHITADLSKEIFSARVSCTRTTDRVTNSIIRRRRDMVPASCGQIHVEEVWFMGRTAQIMIERLRLTCSG